MTCRSSAQLDLPTGKVVPLPKAPVLREGSGPMAEPSMLGP